MQKVRMIAQVGCRELVFVECCFWLSKPVASLVVWNNDDGTVEILSPSRDSSATMAKFIQETEGPTPFSKVTYSRCQTEQLSPPYPDFKIAN